MEQNKLVVIGIQTDLQWENPKQNCSFFEEKIKNIDSSIDIVVLPEMFASGFSMNAHKNSETLDGETISWMKSIAKKNNFAICGSLALKENKQFYNRFVFVHPSGKIDFYNKRHTFTLAGEDKIYTSGNKQKIILFRGWKIYPQICYDLRFPVWTRNTLNYDLLIYVANWPSKRNLAWKTLLKARAIENMTYTIGVNRIGTDGNNLTYTGDSMIVDYLGETVSDLPEGKVGIITTTLEKENQDLIRKKLGFLNDKDQFEIL
jgi:predicted amidohydrolase